MLRKSASCVFFVCIPQKIVLCLQTVSDFDKKVAGLMDLQIVAVVFAYNAGADIGGSRESTIDPDFPAYRKNIRYLSMPAPPIRFQKIRITNVNHSSTLGCTSFASYVIL